MSEEIIKILDYICEKLGIAIDWTAENVWPQVLDIFGRYRIFRLVGSSMWFVASICIMIILAMLWVKAIKARSICDKEHKNNFWWSYRSYGISMEGTFGLLIASVIGGAISLPMFATAMTEFLQWLLIPEIQFLELLKGYVQ